MLKLNILILEGYILGAKILTEFGAMRPTVRPVGEMKKPKMTTKKLRQTGHSSRPPTSSD